MRGRLPHVEPAEYDDGQDQRPQAGPVVAVGNAAFGRLVQRSVPSGTDEESLAQEGGPLLPGLAAAISAERGRGRGLPDPVRGEMERQFGVDFSAVRIHTDERAGELSAAVRAEAFTTGSHLFFAPGLELTGAAGRELLAHELTHVVQQSAGGGEARVSDPGEPAEVAAAAVARSVASRPVGTVVDPSMLGYLQGTAGNHAVAGLVTPRAVQRRSGSTASQAPDAGTAPDAGVEPADLTPRLEAIAKRYRDMIEAARARGAHVAADNLQRFLDGVGGTKTMSVSWLRGFAAVTEAEQHNEGRFESSLNSIANEMSHGQRRTFDDHWDRMLTAGQDSELYYASGTSTVKSTGRFELSMIEDIVSISGTVRVHWYDPYDWHAGLSAYIPGFGSISDEDALLIQRYRGAKPFQMVADWDRRLIGRIQVGTLWNTKQFTWDGP